MVPGHSAITPHLSGNGKYPQQCRLYARCQVQDYKTPHQYILTPECTLSSSATLTWVRSQWVKLIKVTGTRVYLEIAVTRFMQPMPILTPPSLSCFWDGTHSDQPTFCNTNFLQRWSHKDALAPPTWNGKFWVHSSNLFRCVQNCTFCFSMQLEDVNTECESYKLTCYSLHISR